MKFKNIFIKGTVNFDDDKRLIPPDELVDAENALVLTTEGSSSGVMKNVLGNVLKTSYNIVGGKTIGKGTNPSEEKLYNFVCGTNFDYIIEYSQTTNTSTILLQSTAVTGVLNFSKLHRITNCDIITDPEGNGNLLAWSGDLNPPRIVNIERAKTYAIDGFTDQEISVIKAPPVYPVTLTPLQTPIDPQSNFLEDRFTSFCYRYKYQDGYYSAFCSWSEYFFVPNVFELDFDTFENLGMLNAFNSCSIEFDTGGRDVIGIDVIFKLSENSTPYLVESYIKSEQGWADNTLQSIQYSNSKVYSVLPESQYFRSFDNVPLSANCQTLIGSRLTYADFIEQRDLIDKNGNTVVQNYTLSLSATNIATFNIDPTQNNVDYDYGGVPILLVDGSINIDFTGWSFTKGASINIYFRLKSNVQATEFIDTYTYILTQSYFDFNDFIANSGFITDIQNYTNYFTSNGGVVFPNDYVPTFVVEQGFDVAISPITNTCIISFPVIKYEIDETPDPNSFLYEYFYDNNSYLVNVNVAVATSLKSYRSYEICMIYRDEQVRKTTALTSKNNTLFIPNVNAITQNQIKVTVPLTQLPPAWATTYKFGLKLNKQHYETVAINIYFVDGIFRWIKLDGVNKGKIKDGDILIVKRDKNGTLTNVVKVKVLELESKEANFLSLNSSTILEPSGLYAKIKASNFIMQYDVDEFVRYEQHIRTTNGKPKGYFGNFSQIDASTGLTIDRPFNQGSTVHFVWVADRGNEPPFIEYNKTFTAQRHYNNFEQFFNTQILPLGFESTNTPTKFFNVQLVRGFPTYNQFFFGIVASITAPDKLQMLNTYNYQYILAGSFFRDANGTILATFVSYNAQTNTITVNSLGTIAVGTLLYVENIPTLPVTNFSPTVNDITPDPTGFLWLIVEGTESGYSNFFGNGTGGFLEAIVDIRYVSGLYVFETSPLDAPNAVFYETPEVYDVINGQHQQVDHVLTKTFNCYCQGNGVESFQIRDAFGERQLGIDFCPTAVNPDGYRQIRRFADITYSGIYNSNTNVNQINEFNLSLGNYKDDIEKSYGNIVKIKGEDNNLQVYQEDKDSQVFYGKDALYNADGTTNLSRIEEVLGIQDPYKGEFGISANPDSYDDYGFDAYHTDLKRGVVIKKSNNGLFAISSQKMRSYFKDLFRNNTILHINGKYDQYTDFYYLNVQYLDGVSREENYVTWVYSDRHNGWLGRLNFNPEDMVRLNNDFYSFKNGEVYLHNQPVYNEFYGVKTPSKFSFNFSQEPSMRKNFETIEIEGNVSPDIVLTTDYNDGYINSSDFELKEGVRYAYQRCSNSVIDTALLSVQGIGNCTINGLDLNFAFDLPSLVSVGDDIRNLNNDLVGTVVSKTANSLTLTNVQNIVNNDYVMCSKPQSVENSHLLGYYQKVDVTFDSDELVEIFAINTTVTKSFS